MPSLWNPFPWGSSAQSTSTGWLSAHIYYQTFQTPWRFRHDHISHMRLGPSTKSLAKFFIIKRFLSQRFSFGCLQNIRQLCRDWDGCDWLSVIMAIHNVTNKDLSICRVCGGRYIVMKPWQRLESMAYAILCCRLVCWVERKTQEVVRDKNGWEQCALNIDDTLKDASQIDFGSDPGDVGNDDGAGKSTMSSIFLGLIIFVGPSRPSHGKTSV
ncbi:hypothetical protein B0H14DRAFT_2554051 [Mycena olivaceomarginata]|nr:hypothetical protein B0H14DRAFT_2554051 [Mycena olivaceomarginata]